MEEQCCCFLEWWVIADLVETHNSSDQHSQCLQGVAMWNCTLWNHWLNSQQWFLVVVEMQVDLVALYIRWFITKNFNVKLSKLWCHNNVIVIKPDIYTCQYLLFMLASCRSIPFTLRNEYKQINHDMMYAYLWKARRILSQQHGVHSCRWPASHLCHSEWGSWDRISCTAQSSSIECDWIVRLVSSQASLYLAC